MGNIWWWILAALGFAVLSAALFAWLQHPRADRRWERTAIAASAYAFCALIFVWVLWRIFTIQ